MVGVLAQHNYTCFPSPHWNRISCLNQHTIPHHNPNCRRELNASAAQHIHEALEHMNSMENESGFPEKSDGTG